MSFEIYGPDPTVLDTSGRKPHILIVGAGLAGLTLAILLHKADIPFDIFEKSPEARAVGAALFLAPQVLPIFQQLGILDEYLAQSLPCSSVHFFNQDRQPDFQLDFQLYGEITGSESRTIPHSTLHTLLLSRIPPTRIHTSKRMLSFTQGENGVLIRFSDSKTFEGDVLVGADGPNSAVRQGLFEYLRKVKKLPREDAKASRLETGLDVQGDGDGDGAGGGRTVFLVGLTEPLERGVYFPPEEKDITSTWADKEEQCKFFNTRSTDMPFSWNTVTCVDSKVAWSITQHPLALHTPRTSTTPNIDWRSDGVPVESMASHILSHPLRFPAPGLGTSNTLTMGDLIDRTPREQMARVVVEGERVLESWYACRTVLIGDACHKLHPEGNQGAHLALLSASSLFNALSTLPTTQLKHLTPAFKRHKATRLPPTQRAYMLSKALAKVYTHDTSNSAGGTNAKGGKGGKRGGGLLRKVVSKVPAWAWRKVFERLLVDDVRQIQKTVKGITGSSGAPNPSGRNIVNEAMGNAASNGAEDGDEEVLTPEEEEAVEEAVTAVVSAGAEQEEGEYDDDSVGEEGEPKIFMTSATLSKSSASASSPSHSRGGAVVV